ncbi:M23 family metallopeptidase [Anseongella ginsenosidimutans]|nr:M23 family metallopeptidase [Anseongella ginsenosidimutans]QEC51179.1 M23 family metallopeptidase [Anseongella ginsenosidimutans]
MVQKKRKITEKLKDKYKLVILNNETFEEKASVTLNRISVLVAASVIVIVLILLTTALLIFTPLKEYIPGYTDLTLRKEITETAYMADSLEAVLIAQKAYIGNIQDIINGTAGDSSALNEMGEFQTPGTAGEVDLTVSSADSAFRSYIENQDRYSLEGSTIAREKTSISDHTFFTPVKGMVTQHFDARARHYGIDVACQKDEGIKAALDGMVIFSGFTTETGNVIAIQHANNIVSFYKHCSVIFKKVGNFVRSGEAIGVVGNTGEFSSGPHLHFEIWYNGNPVNPADFIRF